MTHELVAFYLPFAVGKSAVLRMQLLSPENEFKLQSVTRSFCYNDFLNSILHDQINSQVTLGFLRPGKISNMTVWVGLLHLTILFVKDLAVCCVIARLVCEQHGSSTTYGNTGCGDCILRIGLTGASEVFKNQFFKGQLFLSFHSSS